MQKSSNDQIITYHTLRMLIGMAGVLLPFLLMLTKAITENDAGIETSISDYYDNSSAGDVFVGVLFALSFFLFSYKGYDRRDRTAAVIAAISALLVALFPTSSCNNVISTIHMIGALCLFSCFIYFSIYLFRKSGTNCTPEKNARNKIYLVCGIIMIVCIVCIGLAIFLFERLAEEYKLVFWFETFALIAFGTSWITKSEYLFLKDQDSQQ